jgi:isoquinoline 1-oxidoreductase beta subunit
MQKVSRAWLQGVLRHAVERANCLAQLKADGNRLRGRCIACNLHEEIIYPTQVAEVSISKNSSDIRVNRMVSAVDCGLVLNPRGAEGQTESAIASGI